MPTTIYKRLNDRDFIYSRNDLRKIAYWAHEEYIKVFEKDPEKIEQEEEDNTYNVFEYPDEWIAKIDSITDWYFSKKRKIGENHIKREAEAIATKARKEKLAAEGKDPNDPKYNNPRRPGSGTGKGKPGQGGGYKGKPSGGGYKGKSGDNQGGGYKGKPSTGQGQGGGYKGKPGAGQGQGGGYKGKPGAGQGGGYKGKPSTGAKRPYSQNRPYSDRQPFTDGKPSGDRATYNSFDSEVSDFGYNRNNFNNNNNNKFKPRPQSRPSYYEAPAEPQFTQKVEIDTGKSTDGTPKRKRIAKALYVVAPPTETTPKSNEE